MIEVGEGDKSLQLQQFLQFVPVTGSRELERKAAMRFFPDAASCKALNTGFNMQ
jgi:hypothetical protein